MRLNEKLRELRKSKNLNQIDIAKLLKVDRTTYGKYETGDSSPDFDKLIKLANFYKVSTDFLFGRGEIFDLGGFIKEEREQQKISRKELSDSIGIPEEELIAYEEDDDPLNNEIANKIAASFGLTFSEFLNKYGLLDEYIPEQFNGDPDKYYEFQRARDKDAISDQPDNPINVAFRDGGEDLTDEEAEYLEQQLKQFREWRKRFQKD